MAVDGVEEVVVAGEYYFKSINMFPETFIYNALMAQQAAATAARGSCIRDLFSQRS